jgi:TonB family protein
VEVKVNVDAEGRVSDARPLNASGSSQRLLGPTAVQAAKLWLFEPARRDGQPVASETVLKFDFARQAR